jgi:tripartite-type tricarboxylate transporter receptor subunit TctC
MEENVLSSARILFCLALLAALCTPACWSQPYPARPIRIVVPQPPGGSQDTNVRVLSEYLVRSLGQNIVIENRGGANGIIAGETVAKASPDGYTLIYTSNSFANNQLAHKKPPFDVLRDFAPVTTVAKLPGYLVIVNTQVPVQSLKDLIELSKSTPTPVRYGSGGIGNSQHLLGELVNNRSGARLMHVPYKGLPLIVNALLGNEVQVAFAAPLTVVQHIKAGRVRVLAYSGAKRWSVMPDVPTVGETLPGFVFEAAWHGMFAPARTPAAILERVQREIAKTVQVPKVRDFLEAGGYVGVADSPAEFTDFLKRYLAETREHMRIANVQPE